MAYARAKGVNAGQFISSDTKRATISSTLPLCPGISNHMIIQNGTTDTIRLSEYYVNWGSARVLPEANLLSRNSDEAIFHSAGGWCATGSSGIISYHLDDSSYLHILWDCPFNFNHFCNFIGLYLCGDSESKPDNALFNRMSQDVQQPGISPKQLSQYDLVCCGPGERSFSGSEDCKWGIRRPCEVQNDKFYVSMTMGDSHQTSSSVTILERVKELKSSKYFA